jgi:hypothetical protein
MFITRNINGERWIHLLQENDSSGGGDSSDIGGLSESALKAYNKRLEKLDGNSQAMAMMLFSENYQLREKNRLLEGRVSPEGTVMLKGEEAAAWKEYQALGAPAEVKQGLDERTKFQGELSDLRRESVLRKVAEVSQFKYSILADRDKSARADQKELIYEFRDIDVDGVKTPTAFIKDGDKVTPAADYAKENWSDYMSVLQVTQGSDSQNGNAQTTSQNGTRFISQTSAGGGNRSQGDPIAKFQQSQAELAKTAKNPLLRE